MAKKESNILNRRLIHSYLSSIISISLVLFLVGVAGLVAVNAGAVSNYFKENIKISALLNLETTDQEAISFAEELQKKEFTKSVEIISKEQGVKEMKALLGEDFLSVFETNPIPISLDIQVSAQYVTSDSLKKVEETLREMPLVDDVAYQESLVELLNANLEKMGLVLAVFILLLLFISFVLINNTVRLNVYSKRFTIHTMRLVGATKGFISRPFIGQAFFQGLISGSVAVLALLGVLYLIRNEFNQLFLMFNFSLLAYVLLGVILLGVLICIISTIFVVRRLVSLTNDELYY
jgi:cell division transport system permease protein